MKSLVLILALAASALAQTHIVMFNNGSSQLQYVCESKNQVSALTTMMAINDGSLTSVVIASNIATVTTPTAHQLYDGARVTVAGSTAGAIDGIYTVASTPSTTTFTITVSAANGTHTESGMNLTTRSPLLSAQYWNVIVLVWEGSVLKATFHAGSVKSTSYQMKCSDRILY